MKSINELVVGDKFKTGLGTIVKVVAVLPPKTFDRGPCKGKTKISVITSNGPFFFDVDEKVEVIKPTLMEF